MRRISWKVAGRIHTVMRRPRETRDKVEEIREREYVEFCKLVAAKVVAVLLSTGKLGKKEGKDK